METHAEKLNIIKQLSEKQLREELIIPLLCKMDNLQVRERHGVGEFGKDITYVEPNKMGNIYYAVVAKTGNISGAASGKDNLQTVMNQVEMSFSNPYFDSEDKQEHYIDRAVIWTSGTISNNADLQIKAKLNKNQNVIFINGDKTLELLEKYYPGFFTFRDPVFSTYYFEVRKYYSQLEELRTLGTSSDKRDLSLVFVPPTFSLQSTRKEKKDHESIMHENKHFSYDYILNLQDGFVIHGDAGSGKTTLIRRMLIDKVNRNEQLQKKEPIPIIIKAMDLDLDDDHTITKLIHREFRKFCRLEDNEPIELNISKVVLLLDGLDEQVNKDQISKTIKLIEEFHRNYADTQIIITSRTLDLLEKPDIFVGFKKFAIQEFETGQIVKFLENWYGKGSLTANKLIGLLSSPEHLGGLPATPFTLTIVSILQENNPFQEIPASQTELFSKYIELALGRWDASKNLRLQFEYSYKKYLLQLISWDMHNKRIDILTPEIFDTSIASLEEQFGAVINREDFSTEIIERSELIFKNEEGNYEFKHRSFRDYFVGLEINRQSNAKDIVVAKILDPLWTQSIFFACGLQNDRDDYLLEILKNVKPTGKELLTYSLIMGNLSQAAFLSTKNTRMRAILSAINSLVKSWDYFYEVYSNEKANAKFNFLLKDLPPQLLFLLLQASISKYAFGSKTLSSVLKELSEMELRELSSPGGDTKAIISEWRLFLIAVACANSETNIEDLLHILDSGVLKNPNYLFIVNIFIDEIYHSNWINASLKEKLGKHKKRIDIKLTFKGDKKSAFVEFRDPLLKPEMLKLPSGSDELLNKLF